MGVKLNQTFIGPLRKGARNESVHTLQERLNEVMAATHGFQRLTPDGIFGSKTDAAVRKFQGGQLLLVDGVVGPKTAYGLGIRNYAAPPRLHRAAMQVASSVLHTLARLPPTDEKWENLVFDTCMNLFTHVEAMRRVIVQIPGANTLSDELKRIETVLGRYATHRYSDLIGGEMESIHGRLLVLANQLHKLARQPGAGTGSPTPLSIIQFTEFQVQMLRQQAQSNAMLAQQHHTLDPTVAMLEIAARVSESASRLLPKV